MRKKPADRRDEILDVALEMADVDGLNTVSSTSVGNRLSIARSLIHHYFGTSAGLQIATVQLAVERKSLRTIAQALVTGMPCVDQISKSLKKQALTSIL